MPSLPSLAIRRWRGEIAWIGSPGRRGDKGFCNERGLRDWDWVDEDEEWPVRSEGWGCPCADENAGARPEDVLVRAIRRVALESVGGRGSAAIGSENGRNGGESSSSSASESGPRGALAVEKRGRRVKARLRDSVAGVSESDDEELEDDSALAEREVDCCLCFGGGSIDLRVVSRLLAVWITVDGLSVGTCWAVDGEGFCV